MKLVQLTDCHLLSNTTDTAYGHVNPYQTLAACLHLAIQEQPDGLLFTGDISGDDSALSYQHFCSLVSRIAGDVPWRVIAGNHDVNPAFDAHLGPNILRADDPWRLGQWFMHGLDSTYQEAQGWVNAAELTTITEHLHAHPHQFHWLCLHHHLIPTGSWMDRHALLNAAEVRQWLADNAQIQGVVHGHIHTEQCHQLAGRAVMAAPSTCWQWQMSRDFGIADERPGFRVLSLCDDGQWNTQVRRIE